MLQDRSYRFCSALSCTILLTICACAETTANTGGEHVVGQVATDPLERIQPAELFRQGEELARGGDPIRAEQYLSTAVQRGFPARQALPLLLRVCIASSRLGAALQYATPYLKLHPDDYHLRYLVAAVQLGLGRPAEARQELIRVLRDAPDYADARYLLGVILRDNSGDSDGAAEQFAAHQRLNAQGLHGAEVAAWLREHSRVDSESTAAPANEAESRAHTSPSAPTEQPVQQPHSAHSDQVDHVDHVDHVDQAGPHPTELKREDRP
jgi:tetratricopeptide (TPR) repeat protein